MTDDDDDRRRWSERSERRARPPSWAPRSPTARCSARSGERRPCRCAPAVRPRTGRTTVRRLGHELDPRRGVRRGGWRRRRGRLLHQPARPRPAGGPLGAGAVGSAAGRVPAPRRPGARSAVRPRRLRTTPRPRPHPARRSRPRARPTRRLRPRASTPDASRPSATPQTPAVPQSTPSSAPSDSPVSTRRRPRELSGRHRAAPSQAGRREHRLRRRDPPGRPGIDDGDHRPGHRG